MNVISMMHEVNVVTDSVICESSLPDFLIAPDQGSEFMRVRALDQLNSAFNRHVPSRGKKQMDMLWHQDESVQTVTAFSTMPVKRFQKDPHIDFNDEQFAAVVSRKGYEVGSGWRDESSRFQEQTPAAESRASVWSLNRHEWNSCPSRLFFLDVSRFGTDGSFSGPAAGCAKAEEV